MENKRIHAMRSGFRIRIPTLIAGLLVCLGLFLAGCSSAPPTPWQLNTTVKGHLPDLKFELTNDAGHKVDAAHYRGKVTLLYFGYTHCPDVCPLTLSHLHMVMQGLGKAAKHAQILFVSVDPKRDTVPVMHQYVTAFDKRMVGLTGDDAQIRQLAKRYRVSYNAQKPNAKGQYEVSHSSAVYIFGKDGRIQLLATPADGVAPITHDVRQLIQMEFSA